MSEHFCIREGRESDESFVLASWVEGDRFSPLGRVAWREAGDESARAGSRRWAAMMLDRSLVRVAHAPADEDALMGFCVYRILNEDAVVLHYVYVKRGRLPEEDARRLGIATALVAPFRAARVIYTHQPVVRGVRIPEGWTYDSYRRF